MHPAGTVVYGKGVLSQDFIKFYGRAFAPDAIPQLPCPITILIFPPALPGCHDAFQNFLSRFLG